MKDKNISITDLTRIRKLILTVIKILENNINDFSKDNIISDKNKAIIDFLFGNKRDIVSIITSLTNALVKVIPLEEKVSNAQIQDEEKLSDDDIEILKRYIDKCNFVFNKKN